MENPSSAESAGQTCAGSTSRSKLNDLCPTSVQPLHIRVREAEKLLTELLRQHQDGAIPDWELLRGLPGMRLEPMSWEEAAKVVGDGSSVALARLGRMPLQSKQYREFRDDVILKKYVSVTDYLYVTVFGLECEREFGPGGHGRERALVPAGFHLGDPVIVWRLNDFPYAFESGIEHHVLWASQPLNDERIQKEAARHKPPDQYEWIYFVNPTLLKSVPAQLCKRRFRSFNFMGPGRIVITRKEARNNNIHRDSENSPEQEYYFRDDRIRGPRSNGDIEPGKFSTIYASQSSILNYSIDDNFDDNFEDSIEEEEDDEAIALKSQNQIVTQALQKVENFTMEDEDLSNFDNDDPERQAARMAALQEMMGALEGLNNLLPLPSKDYGAARARRARDMVEALRGCQTLECVRVAHSKPPGPARHSQVSRPWDKEPEFFSDQCEYSIPTGCPKNETVHYLHHVLRLLRYTGYDGRIATYEASTHYSRNGGRMAKDLYDLFPWLKIVVSLRDPISRAASMLVHMIDKQIVAKGNEVGGCLSAHNMDLGYCLLNESQISGDDWGGPTEYYGPLKAWAEAFPRDQIFVTQYENLTLDAERDELRRLKIFLNLNPDLPSDSVGLGLHNARKKKFNPEGWPMRRQVYEQIVELVRKDCKAVTELISEYGWGDGDAWMASWEKVWADNLATCDENGDCMIQLT